MGYSFLGGTCLSVSGGGAKYLVHSRRHFSVAAVYEFVFPPSREKIL